MKHIILLLIDVLRLKVLWEWAAACWRFCRNHRRFRNHCPLAGASAAVRLSVGEFVVELVLGSQPPNQHSALHPPHHFSPQQHTPLEPVSRNVLGRALFPDIRLCTKG